MRIQDITEKLKNPVSEFNEFYPRLKFAQTRFQLSAGVNLEYNFKWNQPCLSRVSNLSRGLNYLNSATVIIKNKTNLSHNE